MSYEKTIDKSTVYEGVIVNVRRDKAELVNGNIVGREVVEHPGGVTVIPVEADETVWCVRQFRYPFQKVVTELPAGKLEYGEDHRLAALRELGEEVGAVPDELIYLGELYTSPGFSTEVLHMYLARKLRQGEAHPDEDEFLQGERVPLETLLEQVMDGTLVDAKTVALALKAARFLQTE